MEMQLRFVQTGEGPLFVPVSRICIHAVRAVLQCRNVAVGQDDAVEPVALKERMGPIMEDLGSGNSLVAVVEPLADPLGEAEPQIGRQKCPVEVHRDRMAKQGAQPSARLMGGGQGIAVGEMQPVAKVGDFDRLRNERHAQFLREVVPVPGIVVAEQVRDGHAPVGPAGEQALKADEALGDETPVLDVPVEHIAEQVEVVDLACVRLQTLDEGLLLVPLRRAGAAAKVHVGNKENHGTEQKADQTPRS